ncbi:MAG: MarR family transcriptional regulator [Nakamurella sp.]
MRSVAPALMPIFRSSHQAELLTLLLLHPDQDYSVTELARKINVPLTTLHREIDRLEAAGLIQSRAVGRSRLLRANSTSRVVPALTDLLMVTFGPVPVVAEEFAELGAIKIALFGSWAARYRGETGPAPNDVDVLLVGQIDREDAYEAARRAESRLGFPVNPTLMSASRWDSGDDPLTRTIKSSAMVDILPTNMETAR